MVDGFAFYIETLLFSTKDFSITGQDQTVETLKKFHSSFDKEMEFFFSYSLSQSLDFFP